MTTYYVNPVDGLDANNGLGPDASHATNKPWKTMAKALGAAGIASGDIVYMSPGVYRECVSVAMTSPVAETIVRGDPANAQGFKTSGGARIAPGQVQWTAYTTNDKTNPLGSATLDLQGRSFLSFENIFFVGGNANTINSGTGRSTDIRFSNCAVAAQGNRGLRISASTAGAFNLTIEKCRFFSQAGGAIHLVPTRPASGDTNLNIVIRDCFFLNLTSSGIELQPNGSGGNVGGMTIRNCTFFTGNVGITVGGGTSTTLPVNVTNCYIAASGTGISANTLGQCIEDYNQIFSGTPRASVDVGTHSISGAGPLSPYAPLLHFGQEAIWGGKVRPLGTPMTESPMLAWPSDGSQSATDLIGTPRPSGGASANPSAGALERGNTWAPESGTVRTGVFSVSITGPGVQDYDLAVGGAETTISVYVRWDATYAGTKPQLKVLNGAECGVADATATATGSSGAWEQLSLTFTPARAGIVTIRLQSNDTNGGGKVFADDFAVA